MKISIFWTWYVWLVTWTCLAELWHEVLCVDIDKEKIEKLKNWVIPIYEPGLEELVLKNFKERKLNFTVNAKKAIEFWKVIFSAVWTPPDKKNNNKADLKFVYEVAKTFWENLWEYKLFINKSTVPVWTWKNCRNIIKKEIYARKKDIDFDVVSNPEFLREWNAIFDFINPDRIVIWVQNEKSKTIMNDVYAPLASKTKIIFTDIKSAEIIKYASNSFLATKISFINEIANFAEKVWWNVKDISSWMWTDKRIWDKFLESWIWYWGSCFPKDIKAFIETALEFDYEFKIIKATEEVNEKQKTIVVEKLESITDVKWKIISIRGLSYKPNTDDIRDAPSINVIQKLLKLWTKQIKAYDPEAITYMKKLFKEEKKVKFAKDAYEALEESDALIILTEWKEFEKPDIKYIRKLMSWNIIIDWRNIWSKEDLSELDFIYKWIGK